MKKNKVALLILIFTLFSLASSPVWANGGVDLTKCSEVVACDATAGGNCTTPPGSFCHAEGGKNYCCQPEAKTPLGKITLPSWLTWTKAHPGVSGINLLLNNAIKLIFIIASVGLFFMFLWGGINYIFSQGDKARTESARNMITYALIGFAIVALSFALMRLIETFFGISIVGPSKRALACIRPYTGTVDDCKNECGSGCEIFISDLDGNTRLCCPPALAGCDLTRCVDWAGKTIVECGVAHGAACTIELGPRRCCP